MNSKNHYINYKQHMIIYKKPFQKYKNKISSKFTYIFINSSIYCVRFEKLYNSSSLVNLISNRLKVGLDHIVNENRYVFVHDLNISSNIILTQELMKGYHINQ